MPGEVCFFEGIGAAGATLRFSLASSKQGLDNRPAAAALGAMAEKVAEESEPQGEAQLLPPLSPSPEREPEEKLGIGATIADPTNETRKQFLERARKKLKCPMGRVIEKAKAVEGLWELWDDDEMQEETTTGRKRQAEDTANREEVMSAAFEASPGPPKRGRPGSMADLKDRILEGGEIQSIEEYEKIPDLLKLTGRQHKRMVESGKVRYALDALKETQKLLAEADRWADVNGVTRVRRVEEKRLQNDATFLTGVQMIQAAHRCSGEMLMEELRLNRRSEK